jgi:hypothetical protein
MIDRIQLRVGFCQLAGGFVEVFVVEFGDAPLFLFHLLGAVVVELLGDGAEGGDRRAKESAKIVAYSALLEKVMTTTEILQALQR